MAQRVSGVKVSVGFVSETGPRKRNEDFAGAVFGPELPEPRRDVVAAISDGIGSAKGGREAAEIAVRGFLDGFCDLPETMEVRRAAAIVLNALNGWIHSQGQRDPELAGMGCTFTALVLRGRIAHVLHVGDTRAYRLSRDRLTCLTTDHVRQGGSRPVEHPYPRVGRRDGGAAGLQQPAGGAARPLPALQRRCARLSRGRVHRRHHARARLFRGYRARAGGGRARCRQQRQLHRAGARRGRPGNGGIGRHRRRHRAIAADPGAAGRRDHRWFCAQGAACRTADIPACSARRTRSRAARWR